MKKKDYNFILTKGNVFEFEKRLNRLIMITGCLSLNSYYRWKKRPSNILKSIGIERNLLNVTKSQEVYLLQEKINLQYHEKSGIIIRIHDDAYIVIRFGQKIKFTPTEIIYLNPSKKTYGKNRTQEGSTEIRFNVYSNLERAKERTRQEEQYARDYYDSLDTDLDFDWEK